LRGQGAPGSGGAPAGDLILAVHVAADRQFERRGKDIYTTAMVNLAQAMLGGKITVRTLDSQASLKIPPGTKSGAVLRMKNLGVQQNGTRGDQFVKIDIDIPKNLTTEEREWVEKLAHSRGWKTE